MSADAEEFPQASRHASHELDTITIQAWTAVDKTMITAWATRKLAAGPSTVQLGACILDYRLLILPTYGQVVWCLGDELKSNWRELSSPKE